MHPWQIIFIKKHLETFLIKSNFTSIIKQITHIIIIIINEKDPINTKSIPCT